MHDTFTRREALKTAALSLVALPLSGAMAHAATATAVASDAAPAPAMDGAKEPLRLGVTSYSTRNLTLEATIETVKILRIANLALFKKHCDWETASVDECRAVGDKLKAAGLSLTGSGVVNLPNDEAKARKAFENVRAAGMATMVCKPAKDAFPLVEKLAKEFDQKLAIHNHGPEDESYPTPDVIWRAIQSLDSRIGLCVDVGHTARAGGDPAAAIRSYASRLYDVHMKDSVAVVGAKKDVPIEVGAGRLDIRGILRALVDVNYRGVVTFEYEKVAANPVPGLAESVGYVRGVMGAIAG
jgi:sugar phosphate isomerase/epimerase